MTLKGFEVARKPISWVENVITILGERLRILEAEKRELDDAIKGRNRTITSIGNQVTTLESEKAELKKTLNFRDSTIAHQARALDFFSTTCAPVIRELPSRV